MYAKIPASVITVDNQISEALHEMSQGSSDPARDSALKSRYDALMSQRQRILADRSIPVGAAAFPAPLIVQSRDVIEPKIAAQIVMESAVAMAKIDPATIGFAFSSAA